MKLTNRAVQSGRVKEHETWKNTLINKERDKLLQEFLLAREELKIQFDCEKRELVGNYERRLRYLRRLLEDCDENINMLKLNLDAEKEENFILKTKIMELEREKINREVNEKLLNSTSHQKEGYLNQSYDKDSISTSYPCSRNNSTHKSSYQSYDSSVPERSSIDGLKYSDRFASCGSLGKDSCFTSVSTLSTVPSCIGVQEDAHANCRKEFNRLLKELRNKQNKYDSQLEIEKERMNERIQNEKIQLERIVYRQLNARLDREIKKQEFLLTENAHLRRTISNTIMERIHCECKQQKHEKSNKENERHWKESNSDSGADVGDNQSDDGSDGSDSGKGSLTRTTNYFTNSCEDLLKIGLIDKVVENPNGNDSDNVFLISPTRINASKMMRENRYLKEGQDLNVECLEEVAMFQEDLRRKLFELEALLNNDEDQC